jgi:hypothetical protein
MKCVTDILFQHNCIIFLEQVNFKLDSTSNGIYSVDCTNINAIITGLGQEMGDDGANPIEMVAVVSSASIVINVVN